MFVVVSEQYYQAVMDFMILTRNVTLTIIVPPGSLIFGCVFEYGLEYRFGVLFWIFGLVNSMASLGEYTRMYIISLLYDTFLRACISPSDGLGS